MAKINRLSGVLNQFGSPSLNSNTFANRPDPGQPGRLFVSIDTLLFYRDTGTVWTVIGGAGSTPNLQQVTTVGSRTNQRIFIGPTSVTPSSADLDVYGYGLFRNTVNSQLNLGTLLYSQYTINYNGSTLSGFANSLFAQDVYNVSASTTVASSTQAGTSLNINTYKFSTVSTITFDQPSSTIRAASALTAYSQFQNTAAGTITHAAGITILGVENLGGSSLTINNNYQLLINASDEFASTATFNPLKQWGIYQSGVKDRNYFAAPSIFNTRVDVNDILVVGNSIYTTLIATNIIRGNTTDINFYNNSLTTVIGTLFTSTTGNLRLGLGADSLRKLQVVGQQEWITATDSNAHTPNVQHLPIWVNGQQFYLQLYN